MEQTADYERSKYLSTVSARVYRLPDYARRGLGDPRTLIPGVLAVVRTCLTDSFRHERDASGARMQL